MARVAIAQAAQVRTGATPQERLVGNKAEAWKSSASKHVAQAQLSSRSRCDEQPPLRESALIGTTIAFALTLPFAAAHAHPASSEVGSVAQSQGFWENMAACTWRFSVYLFLLACIRHCITCFACSNVFCCVLYVVFAVSCFSLLLRLCFASQIKEGVHFCHGKHCTGARISCKRILVVLCTDVRFSVSVALGFVITIWRPVGVFFKRWWSALLLFVLLGVSVWGTKVTLTAMLGLDDPSVVAS